MRFEDMLKRLAWKEILQGRLILLIALAAPPLAVIPAAMMSKLSNSNGYTDATVILLMVMAAWPAAMLANNKRNRSYVLSHLPVPALWDNILGLTFVLLVSLLTAAGLALWSTLLPRYDASGESLPSLMLLFGSATLVGFVLSQALSPYAGIVGAVIWSLYFFTSGDSNNGLSTLFMLGDSEGEYLVPAMLGVCVTVAFLLAPLRLSLRIRRVTVMALFVVALAWPHRRLY